MIYVLDAYQVMTERCACAESPNGLRTLSVNKNLTNNPLTGTFAPSGMPCCSRSFFASSTFVDSSLVSI